ncbi:hypothetical protein EJ05DRAFT_484453 [Pseudovirgaria hyperparasitica]|uniref:Uncharacterized protein n=1 Tax=Pseudovirgaria hyperparasitica TaxID=470096 RepID=A0A6A6WAA4_9PEZI|nr:uncharacterized protein EJ05DRAFT_484453 [Pseudovirgaria hyperparasitica]KAF2759505.1 hypothetical protein EJ05DRAFT_484453 [Pseudovirgaria hyperparasitica]
MPACLVPVAPRASSIAADTCAEHGTQVAVWSIAAWSGSIEREIVVPFSYRCGERGSAHELPFVVVLFSFVMYRGFLIRVALVLVLALCGAAQDDSQRCWYPDGKTQPPDHVPCNKPDGGESPGGIAVLHGCDADPMGRYTCGINSTCNENNVVIVNGNDEFDFRPAQLQALIASTTPSPLETSSEIPNTGFSAVEMAGVGIGVGIPLLIAITTLAFLLWREKRHVRDIQKQAEKDLLTITSTHQTEIARHENIGFNRGRESLTSKTERVPLELDSRYRHPNKGSMSSGSTAVTQARPELSATASHIYIPKEARLIKQSLEGQVSPASSSLYHASPHAGRSSQDVQTRSRTSSSVADTRTSRDNMDLHSSRSPPTSRSPRAGPSRSSATVGSSRDNIKMHSRSPPVTGSPRDASSWSPVRAGPSREMDHPSRSPQAVGRSSREYQTRSPTFGTYSPVDPSPVSSGSPVGRLREEEVRNTSAQRGTASPWDDRTPRWI